MEPGSIILIWIVSIVSLLIGYYLGKGSNVLSTAAKVISDIKHEVKRNGRVGGVNGPTAKDLYYMKDPQGIKKKEEEDAMRELIEEKLVQ